MEKNGNGLRPSAVWAPNGMAATSQPLAVQAGIDILRNGGNAVDAAVGINAVLSVVEPGGCGIGGDLFAIIWDAQTKQLYGLNSSGRAPKQATMEEIKGHGHDLMPETGPLTWTVPGCVDGWFVLLQRFGSIMLKEALKPAIEYARRGFPVTPKIAAGWSNSAEKLSGWPDSASTFLIDDKAPAAGQMFKNPFIAETLEEICNGGRDAFYKGAIADEIDKFSRKIDALLRKEDMAEYMPTWVEPVSVNYRGLDVWALPPNCSGIAALQILNILSGYDLKSMGRESHEYYHLLAEATKLVFADRANYYADPDFARVPVEELLSTEYAEQRRGQIGRDRAAERVTPGLIMRKSEDTVYITVVDARRNAISLIQSQYANFGSGVVPGGLGFTLQNRGAGFSLDPSHPCCLEPGKRPFHTIMPGFVTRDGKPYMSYGVMGGDMQPQGQAQTLINMVDFGMDPQAAGYAARVQVIDHPTVREHKKNESCGVALEGGISESIKAGLERLGHRTEYRGAPSFGGYQCIRIHEDGLEGGSDPRKDGYAAGY